MSAIWLVPPTGDVSFPRIRCVPCNTRCTGRPRPIPGDGFMRCGTKSCAETSCGAAWVAVRATTAHRVSTGPPWTGSKRSTASTGSSTNCPANCGKGPIGRFRRGGCISQSRERPSKGRCRFRRRRHSAATSSDDLGFVVVTHPFHPLIGQRLEILYLKRRGGDTVFVCSGGVSGQITVPQAWTDRGEPAGEHRLSMAGLAALAAVTRALGVVDRHG